MPIPYRTTLTHTPISLRTTFANGNELEPYARFGLGSNVFAIASDCWSHTWSVSTRMSDVVFDESRSQVVVADNRCYSRTHTHTRTPAAVLTALHRSHSVGGRQVRC